MSFDPVYANRAAVEYEKKVYASNLEQSQAMEKSLMSMAHEIDKLHKELADKRARAAAATATTTHGYYCYYYYFKFCIIHFVNFET